MRSQSLHDVSKLLNQLVRRTGEPGDLTEMLRHIAQTAQTYFDADTCNIFANNPITGHFIEPNAVINPITGEFIEPYTVAGKLLKYRKESPGRPSPGGLTERVLKRGILLVEDVETAPEYQSTFTRLEEIHSFVGLALRTNYTQKPLAVLYLNFRQALKFTVNDNEIFQIFAYEASFMLQETWLLLRYQEVARIGKEINLELSTADVLFNKLQKRLAGILDTSYAFLLAVFQPQTNKIDLYLEDEGQSIVRENDPLEGACQYVIETKETLFVRQMSKESKDLRFQRVTIDTEGGPKESVIFVPLLFRDVSLGAFSIQHKEPYAYDQEDLFILQLLANHITLALYNMRLYDNLGRLNEAGQLLTQQLASNQVLQATAHQIQDATKADIVVLYPYDSTTRRFMVPPRIAGNLCSSSLQSMFPSRPDDIAALMLDQGEPIFAKESAILYTKLHGDLHIQQGNFQERENIRSTAALPLRVGDVSVGVLFINFRQAQRFDASQKLLIEGLAHFAAIAIKNAQEFGTLIQRRVHELEILQNIDRELTRNLDLNSVLNTLLSLALEHVPAEEVSILLPNFQKQILETAAAIGSHAETSMMQSIPFQETRGVTRWVMEHKKPVCISNVRQDQLWRDIQLPVAEDTISELDVPLLDGEEIVGILNFESVKEDAFSQEDQDFLVTLAGQAILAIKNAQAYEREKRFVAEGQVLNQISKEIISQLDTTHIFNLILEKALDLTNASTGALMLYDPELNDLWMAAERGVIKDKKGDRLSLDQGIAGYVATNKQLLNVDPSQPPYNEIYLDYIPGTRSELAVPMLAGNELRGILDVESPTPNNFKENDERLLKALADLAVVALQQAQAYEREKRLAAESQVLNQISKEIIGQLDPFHVFDLILEKALELTHSRTGTLELYDPDRNDLSMAAERGVAEEKKGQRLSLDQGVVGYVARNKKLLNADLSQSPWKEVYVPSIFGTRSELAVPMLAGNELRGILNIESSSPNHFNESDERLLQGLADLAVVALQNAQAYEKAEKAAQHFELLYQAGRELSEITELSQLELAYNIILQIAEQQSQSQVVIRRYEEETQELVLVLASDYQKVPPFSRMRLDEGLNGQVAREQRTIAIDDTTNPSPGVSLKLSDPAIHSLVLIPIKFKDRYYGNLGLSHEEVGYFRGADINFYEALAQQLASTIYRLEIAEARQALEQRALSAEEMSSIGQSAFEITHRLGNDLGLVESYVEDIEAELGIVGVNSTFISRKLRNIAKAARTVLDLSGDLKEELARSGAIEETAGKPVTISPKVLLEHAQGVVSLPSNIQMYFEIEADVANVQVIPDLVADILRNLVVNALEAMPKGGKITLRARNVGHSVALEVADTGIGIPQQKLSKIFDLFYSTKRSSGFGLWSARRYALRNHGDLKVESRLGQGATFTLLLPRIDGEDRKKW